MKCKCIALLGQQQAIADGVFDYTEKLAQSLQKQGCDLQQVQMPWREQGWTKALQWLWQASLQWQDRWAIVQFTASAWSKLALPVMFVLVVRLLKIRSVRVAVMFHEVQGYPGDRWKYKIRRWVQLWTIQTAMKLADRSIFNVSLEQLTWLPIASSNATFIPVGSNMLEPDLMMLKSRVEQQYSGGTADRAKNTQKTVVVFGMTSIEITQDEVEAIARAIEQTSQKIPHLHLVTLGRGSKEAEEALRKTLQGVRVDISVLGMLEPEEITQILVKSDVMLFVRGEICTRKTTAISGLSCGLPIIAYTGKETAHPLPEAGVLLVPQGDRDALASALIRVLEDDQLWLELHKRSLEVYKNYFAWDTIAKRFIEELNL